MFVTPRMHTVLFAEKRLNLENEKWKGATLRFIFLTNFNAAYYV